jgi:uncharacterized protein (TIGR00245 family)
VSLARTLANSPEVLLLDEPTSALDEKSARGIEELLLGIIRERQMTCVMITHDMQQAARIADRTMYLKAGRLVAVISNDGVETRQRRECRNDGSGGCCCALPRRCPRLPVVRRTCGARNRDFAPTRVIVGMVLALLLHGNALAGMLILLAMTFAATVTASRRAKGIKDALLLCFYAITAGGGTVIAAMLATRTLKPDIAILVPVGSMIIANAMNACAQAIERFTADIKAHVGEVEAGLALGAEPGVTVVPYVQSAVYASLLPRLDMLKSLGLVWIPGVMAGMMVSGASPIYAGIYQFIIVAMILAASA